MQRPVLVTVTTIALSGNVNLEIAFDKIVLFTGTDSIAIQQVIPADEVPAYIAHAHAAYKIFHVAFIAAEDSFNPHEIKKEMYVLLADNIHRRVSLLVPYIKPPMFSPREDGYVRSAIVDYNMLEDLPDSAPSVCFTAILFKLVHLLCYETSIVSRLAVFQSGKHTIRAKGFAAFDTVWDNAAMFTDGGTADKPLLFLQDKEGISFDYRFSTLLAKQAETNADVVGSHIIQIDEREHRLHMIRYPLTVRKELLSQYKDAVYLPAAVITKQALNTIGELPLTTIPTELKRFVFKSMLMLNVVNADDFLYLRRPAVGTGINKPAGKDDFYEWRWHVDYRLVSEGKLDLQDSSLVYEG